MERVIYLQDYRNKVKAMNRETDINKRRKLTLEAGKLHATIRQIDHMGGMCEMFRLKNGVVVLRQEIFRTEKSYWYVVQDDGSLVRANEAQSLEKAYDRNFSMG